MKFTIEKLEFYPIYLASNLVILPDLDKIARLKSILEVLRLISISSQTKKSTQIVNIDLGQNESWDGMLTDLQVAAFYKELKKRQLYAGSRKVHFEILLPKELLVKGIKNLERKTLRCCDHVKSNILSSVFEENIFLTISIGPTNSNLDFQFPVSITRSQ